jgi:hypothetical protein
MDLQTAGNWLTFLVGAIVVAATVVAFYRANFAKTQIELLKGERDAANDKITRLEIELKEERTLRTSLDNKVKVLEKVVTGREQLIHIQESLDNHDKRVDERHDTLIKYLTTREELIEEHMTKAVKTILDKIEDTG